MELECSSNKSAYQREQFGVCLPSSSGETCLDWELEIKEDGTFTELVVSTKRSTGILFSSPTNKEGTYTTLENQITLNYSSGLIEKFTLNELETTLSGKLSGATGNGCTLTSVFTRI